MKKTIRLVTKYTLLQDRRNSIYVNHNGVESYCELKVLREGVGLFGRAFGFIRLTKKQYRRIFEFINKSFTVIVYYDYKILKQKTQ